MIREAAYQAIPKSDFSCRKKQIFAAIELDDKNHVDCLCFPEGFLTGYYEDREEAIQSSLDISDTSFQERVNRTKLLAQEIEKLLYLPIT